MLLVRRLWNIQPIGQYLNWDSTKALKSVLLLKESKFAALEKPPYFWLALLQSFSNLSNFRSLSIVTPRSLTYYFPRLNLSLYSPILNHIYNLILSDDIYLCSFSYLVFKLTYSKHRVFLKWFQNISKLSSEIYVVVSSPKLHTPTSFRKKNKSFG